MEKRAYFGVGYSRPINQEDKWSRENRLAVNYGFPHLIAIQASPGPMKGTPLHVGWGLTGPQIGVSFGPKAHKEPTPDKDTEDKTAAYHQGRSTLLRVLGF